MKFSYPTCSLIWAKWYSKVIFFPPCWNIWKENHIDVFISLLEQCYWILIFELVYPSFPRECRILLLSRYYGVYILNDYLLSQLSLVAYCIKTEKQNLTWKEYVDKRRFLPWYFHQMYELTLSLTRISMLNALCVCIRTSGLIKFNCSVSVWLGLIKIQPCFWASRSGLADLHRAILQQTIKVIKAYNNNQYNANTPLTYKSSRKWSLEAFSSASGDKIFETLYL